MVHQSYANEASSVFVPEGFISAVAAGLCVKSFSQCLLTETELTLQMRAFDFFYRGKNGTNEQHFDITKIIAANRSG